MHIQYGPKDKLTRAMVSREASAVRLLHLRIKKPLDGLGSLEEMDIQWLF
jgi:hypothetical protein